LKANIYQSPGVSKTVNEFITGISIHVAAFCSRSLQAEDTLHSELSREVENGRLARLLIKMGTINERPEYEGDRNWSENGERYMLKLFRDYVFHQVDAQGAPVIDLGHIIKCVLFYHFQ
jgi:PAB-dependent poly(A)-specific ribonuclease subunit 3